MKSGFVSLIGRPNAGKSTLLNSLIGTKVAITSEVSGTTRNIIQGIYHDKNLQIIFVDTPGIHKPKNKLGKILNQEAYFSLSDVDVILYIVDITDKIGKGDNFIIEKLKETNIPVILVLNKIDKITYEQILPKIAEYKDLYPFKEIIPLSAIKKKNIEDLIETVSKYLKDNIKYYDDETITNVSTTFKIQELIREKALSLTKEEVPHSITCIVENIESDNKTTNVYASIIVDRENLKKILIGSHGSMIKNIGIKAREEIEVLLNKKVYLDLKVKVIKDWKDKDSFLNSQLGLKDFNE